MAYHVVKTINGIRYLYKQRSYRVGKQVKTDCVCLGRVDGGGVLHEGTRPHHDRIESTTTETQQNALETIKAPPEAGEPPQTDKTPQIEAKAVIQNEPMEVKKKTSTPPPQQRPPPNTPKFATDDQTPLHIKVDMANLGGMSKAGLEKEFNTTLKRLNRLGASSVLPSITIKYGKTVKSYKQAFKNGYVVTVPRWERGNREKVRAEYRKLLARFTLDQLQTKQPETFLSLAYRFDRSYQATQTALASYILATNSRKKFATFLALKWFGNIGYLNQGLRGKLAPEKVGLVEYGKRLNWQDEFCSIMAKIQRVGFDEMVQKTKMEFYKAKAEERRAIEEKTIFIFRRRRRLKRAIARMEIQKEMLRKLETIKTLFGFVSP